MFDFVKDNGFDIEKTSEYILSIQVNLDGFSFLVAHPVEKKILAFQYSPVKSSNEILISRYFKEWIFSNDIFQKNFQKISVVVFSNKFSPIPEIFYHERLKNEIQDVLFGKNGETEIAENYIEKLKARLIFALPKGLNELVNQFFGECEIIHPLKLVLKNLPSVHKKYGIALLINTNNFYAVIYNENDVLLVNNFNIAHVNDVVYFVLNTLQQLKISVPETDLFLAGVNNNLPLFSSALQPYFENVAELKPDTGNIKPEFTGNFFLPNFLSF